MQSTQVLKAAMDTQADRGAEYDSPAGERSMPSAVAAFNAITGLNLSTSQGYLLLAMVKQVRLHRASGLHLDSGVDLVSYDSLQVEAMAQEKQPCCGVANECEAVEPAPLPVVVPVIGFMPPWHLAPEGTRCAVLDAEGALWWCAIDDPLPNIAAGGWYVREGSPASSFFHSELIYPPMADWFGKVFVRPSDLNG